MPQNTPAGLTPDHVLKAIADLDADIDHPFGDPTVYSLEFQGNSYPPKAVVGLAMKYHIGRAAARGVQQRYR